MINTDQVKLLDKTVTASGDTKTTPVDVRGFKSARFFIKASGVSGTSPTCTAKIIVYCPCSGEWHDLETFTALTADGKEMKLVTDIGAKIAVLYTIGGTSPSFDLIVSAALKTA